MHASIKNAEIFKKIRALSFSQKKEINSYIDGLIVENSDEQKAVSKNNVIKKKILLDISIWNENDLKPIKTSMLDLKKWKIHEF